MSFIHLLICSASLTMIINSEPARHVFFNQSSILSQEPDDVDLLKVNEMNCTNVVHYCVKNDDCLNTSICGFDSLNCTVNCIFETKTQKVEMLYNASANETKSQFQAPVKKTNGAQEKESNVKYIVFFTLLGIMAAITIASSCIVCICDDCKRRQELKSDTIALRDFSDFDIN